MMNDAEPPDTPKGCHNTPLPRRSALLRGAAGAGFAALGATTLTSCDAVSSPQQRSLSQEPPAPGVHLIALDALVAGQSMVLTPPGSEPVVLARTGTDEVAAHSGICTHQGCTVAPTGATVRCPCHGSIFNAATGAVIKGPARTPLAAIAVRVVKNQVVTT